MSYERSGLIVYSMIIQVLCKKQSNIHVILKNILEKKDALCMSYVH